MANEFKVKNGLLVTAGNAGIGITIPQAKIHSNSITEQLRLSYDGTNYSSFTINSSGNLTITPSGTVCIINASIGGTSFSSSKAWDATTSAGGIYLNGTTGNRIDFNANGSGAPTFTTRSVGTKIVLYPNADATNVDFALGIDASTLWQSVNAVGSKFKWYGGTTEQMTLSSGSLGINATSPAARVHSISTTEQLRLGYDATKYTSFTTSSVGNLTIAPTNAICTISAAVGVNSLTSGTISASGVITSTVAQGTAPFTITSSTPVSNLSIGGNAGSATVLATARTINGVSFNGSADIMVPSLYDGNYRRITNPGGGEFIDVSGSRTGAIAITMPVAPANMFVKITVKIYEYNANGGYDVVVSGQASGGNSWANYSAYIVGNPSVNRLLSIRFGYAGGKPVIYIGELATTWAYPQVYITEVLCGYSSFSANYTTGWTIGFEASAFSGVIGTVSNCQVGYGTTVGLSLSKLANPSAIRFIQINADNSVSALDAAGFRTAIGAGTSSTSGTVTSVAMSVPTGLTITGSPISTSGTLALSLTSGYSIPTTSSQTNWDTAYTQVSNATSDNTISTIVKRGTSGEFASGPITMSATQDTASLGAELVTNGTFTSNLTGWTGDANWTWSSGVAAHSAGSGGALTQTITGLTIDYLYYLTVTVVCSAGSINPTLGTSVGGPGIDVYSASGTYTTSFRAAGTSQVLTFTPSSTFVGSIDSVSLKVMNANVAPALVIKSLDTTNAIEIRSGGPGLQNTFIGVLSGRFVGSGYNNTAVGNNALSMVTAGMNNTAVGSYSQANVTSGRCNTAIGTVTQIGCTSGSFNTALGNAVQYSLTTGYRNTAGGYNSQFYITTGYDNTAYGAWAQTNLTTGYDNVAIGAVSQQTISTGVANVSVGRSSLGWITTGSYNTALGNYAGSFISNGSTANATPSGSIFIGYNTKALADGQSNQIVIGYDIVGLGSNTTVIGNGATTITSLKGSVGVGTDTPSAKIHSVATSEQLRLGYDAAHYASFTSASDGNLSINPSGGNTTIYGAVSTSDITHVGTGAPSSLYIGYNPVNGDLPASALGSRFYMGFVANQSEFTSNYGHLFGTWDYNGSGGPTPGYAYQLFKPYSGAYLQYRHGLSGPNRWSAWETILTSGQFVSSASGSSIVGPDASTINGVGYVTSISLFGQSDGALYTQAHSSPWVHQIYGDYRTGQIAIRGKNNNTWQAWRTVLDSSNYNTVIGTAGGFTGTVAITKAWDATTGAGGIYLNGATGNRIDFNINGVGAPTFTTRSVGTKVVLYPAIDATNVDFALGIEGSCLWQSVNAVGSKFKWYGGTTEQMTLSAGSLGVNTPSPAATIHATSTGQQLRLGYDATKYTSFTTDSVGNFTTTSTIGVSKSSATVTTTSTTQTLLASYAIATYISGEYLIQAVQGTTRQITKLLVIHDGTTAYATEYSTIMTGARVFNADVDISGGYVRLLVTTTGATSTTYKTSFTLIGV